jgi:type I restriction enzyme S subunit
MSERVPEGWRYSEIQTIVKDYKGSIVDGPFGSNLKTSDYVESGVPVLQGKNVTNDRFLWSDVRYITVEKAKDLSRSSVRVGEILMVKIGSVGYSAIVDNLNNFDFAIIPANLLKIDIDGSKADTKYVHHYMTSPEGKRRIIDEASSTAQPALSLGTMKKFKLPIPPLPEQKKIASILSSVDDVIETTQKQIDKLQNLKKATMNELLTKGIGHTEFKDSELGRIPKSWEVKEIGKLGDIVTGSTPSTTNRDLYDGNYMFVSPADISDGMFISKTGKKLSLAGLNKTRKIPEKSVMVVCIGSTIGKVAISTQECASNQQINSIIPQENDAYFVYFAMKWMAHLIKKEAGTQAVPLINKTEFSNLFVPVPPRDEQMKIGIALHSINVGIDKLNAKLSQTQSLKKSLMQDLLTGKVRVQVN